MTILPRLPFTKRLKEVLEANTGTMPVGLGAIPRVGGVQQEPPYFILYPLWSDLSGPQYADPDADAEWTYQISCYGARTDQIEWMRDRVTAIMLGRSPGGGWQYPVLVDGMKVMDRWLKEDVGTTPENESALLSSDMRYGVKVTPV